MDTNQKQNELRTLARLILSDDVSQNFERAQKIKMDLLEAGLTAKEISNYVGNYIIAELGL